jgi:hypothetical protein
MGLLGLLGLLGFIGYSLLLEVRGLLPTAPRLCRLNRLRLEADRRKIGSIRLIGLISLNYVVH